MEYRDFEMSWQGAVSSRKALHNHFIELMNDEFHIQHLIKLQHAKLISCNHKLPTADCRLLPLLTAD